MSGVQGHGSKLSRAQEAAICALLSHPTVLLAARSIGVGVSTLRRWTRLPEFAAAYGRARANILQAVSTELENGALEATVFLRGVVRNEDNALPYRISAARTIVEHHWRAHEVLSLAERMRQIEEHLKLPHS
jgi:hypothetical protein